MTKLGMFAVEFFDAKVFVEIGKRSWRLHGILLACEPGDRYIPWHNILEISRE